MYVIHTTLCRVRNVNNGLKSDVENVLSNKYKVV